MSKHERQSLYFNEDNLYLYQYVKKKRKPNEWVLELIRQAYRQEKGLTPQEEKLVATLGTPASPELTQLMAQVQVLTQQVATLQQPTTLRAEEKVEPIQSTPHQPKVVKEPEVVEVSTSVVKEKPQVEPVKMESSLPHQEETLPTPPKRTKRFSSTNL